MVKFLAQFFLRFACKLLLTAQLSVTQLCSVVCLIVQPVLFVAKLLNGTSLGKSLLSSNQVIALAAASWVVLSVVSNATAIQWTQGDGASYVQFGKVLNQLDDLVNVQPAQQLLQYKYQLKRFPAEGDVVATYGAKDEPDDSLALLSYQQQSAESAMPHGLPVSPLSDRVASFDLEPVADFEDARLVGFFTNGVKAEPFQLAYPLLKFTITSHFGWRHQRPHRGIDLSAPYGSGIYAAEDGVVVMAKYYYGYGQLIIIDHGNGYKTAYAHLKDMLPELGDRVTKGQMIGTVGMTGRSTGPHLHFEVMREDVQINPYPLLKRQLAKDQMV